MQTYTLTFEIHEDAMNLLDAHSAVAAMARAFDRNCPLDSYEINRKPVGTLVAEFTGRFGNPAEVISKQAEMQRAGEIPSVERVESVSISIVTHTPA